MANLMLRKSSKDVVVVRSKPDIRCKKHPKHKQSPGVCSLCLREKLSQLSSTSSSSRGYSATMESSCSSSSSSSYYSSSTSSCSSPMHRYDRFTTEGKNSLLSLLLSSKNVLTKSRSLILVPRMKTNKEGDGNGKTKKSGFLSKLLRPRSKKSEEFLVHSRTVREIRVENC